jgi:hypothetical protein
MIYEHASVDLQQAEEAYFVLSSEHMDKYYTYRGGREKQSLIHI